LKGIQN